MVVFLAFLVSCSTVSSPLESGEWTLRGSGVVGHLSTLDGCKIAIWGGTWGTPSDEVVQCRVRGDDLAVWIEFEIETSVGGGVGSLKTAKGATWALLPLGSRDGEWEVQLQMSAGTLSEEEITASASQAANGREELSRGWSDGGFVLSDATGHVGELLLRGDGLVEVAVYDERWLSDGRQVAETTSVGPDLYLSFPVMPAFTGELGGIIVNRVVGEAVVPLGVEVTPADRVLQLTPGLVSDGERAVLVEAAKSSALERERIVLHPMAIALYGEHTSTFAAMPMEQMRSAACGAWVESELWSLQLVGYEVSFFMGDSGGCELWIEPSPVQHLRRLSVGIVEGQIVEALHDY